MAGPVGAFYPLGGKLGFCLSGVLFSANMKALRLG